MQKFDTPTPISAVLDIPAGRIRFIAADRADTAVEVLPADASKGRDVKMAEQTTVEYGGGVMRIEASAKDQILGPSGSIEVTVQLPAGSRIEAKAASAELRAVGRLGDVTFEGSHGSIKLDEAASVRLTTDAGDVEVGRLNGPAEVSIGKGDIRIAEAVRGTVVLRTQAGDVSVGAATGVSAALDASTAYGRINNGLKNDGRRRTRHPRDHRLWRHRRPQPLRSRTMTNLAIAANALRKSYGDKVVLDGVDLAVPEGTIFSLLGPNGAGKTTAVKILSTLISPDPSTGDIRVGGHNLATDPQAVRAAIGVTGQFSAVDGLITGEENMLLMADLHHLSRSEGKRVAAELLERFDLVEAVKKPASTYSGGMKRRLDIAMTLVGNPRIIFLDEPTTGLDPRSRHNMWQIIRELVMGGVTVFLTTQYLEEADELADHIAVLNNGKMAAQGTAEELKRLIPGGHVRLRFTDPAAYQSAALALREATRDDESLALQIPSDGSQRELRSILDWLDSAAIEADELTVHTPDLDDVFFALTGTARARPAAPQPAQGGCPMSSLSLAVRDSSTMLRRNLLHARRYPSLTLNLLLTPIMLLLLFVYLFGDTMSAGIGGGADAPSTSPISSRACC